MSEVSDIAIKRTQDTLGKIIKKPVLTDKLLRKPPFKFLHDIIHAVIDTTGFLDGLYTADELQSENIKDREAKIAFLQKTIDALKLATQQEVRARPSKIVAGLEADKTNELLLAIGKAIDRKIDTTEAVALVKHGNVSSTPRKESKTTKTSKTQSKSDPRKVKKETKETAATKKTKSTVGSDGKTAKKSDSNAKVSKQSSKESTDSKKAKAKSPTKIKEKEKRPIKKEEKNAEKNVEKSANVEVAQQKTEAPQTNGFNSNDVIENHEPKPNETKIKSAEMIVKQNELPKQPSVVNDEKSSDKREKTPKTPEKRVKETVEIDKIEMKKAERETLKSSASLERKKSDGSASNDSQLPAMAQEKTENAAEKIEQVEKVDRHSSDKPRSSRIKRSHSKPDIEKPMENGTAKSEEKFKSSQSVDKLIERSHGKANDTNGKQSKPPRTALRSAAARPISARPSAPRRRDRNVRQIIHTESFVQDSGDSSKTDKKTHIPEFDDADNIVITETIPDNISAIDDSIVNNVEGEIDGKQGHLVQQILETQTAILKSDAKNNVSAVSDESILNDRKSITRNMTELRKMIQKLSLYITPLGKMMEYFQEDVDAMQIELLMWQKAGESAAAEIQGEQQITEKMLEAFKYNLAEINNSIKDHAEQINNTTMNIIQNEEKISKLISSL